MTNFLCQEGNLQKMKNYGMLSVAEIKWRGGLPVRIQKSAEDYLETILMLSEQGGTVRSIDIAGALGFSKPSVSTAMKRLRENGYIKVEHGAITLTPAGAEIAQRIYDRHRLLTAYLVDLGVSPQTAEEDACGVEHILSEETIACIRAHYTARRTRQDKT